MFSKRDGALLLLCFFCWLQRGSSDQKYTRAARDQTPSTTQTNPAFYMTTEFILQLNELIKHLATFALDESLETREAIANAGYMWNGTVAKLEDLVKRSEDVPTGGPQLRKSIITDFTLRDALAAIRTVKSKFLAQTGDQMVMEIDAIAFIDRDAHFQPVDSIDDSAVMRIMHSSVHDLTNVSAQLLRTLERVESRVLQAAGNGRSTSQVEPSITLFLDGFHRTIVDIERNFQTQANRTVRHIRSLLSTLEQNQQLGVYVDSAVGIMNMFTTDVTSYLDMAYTSVSSSMTDYTTLIDQHLSTGLTNLLTTAGSFAASGFLHRCLKRFVFTYYDQSLAVAKLLYCSEPEKTTLEYLVTVAIPILKRAAITATSATQMDVVCSSSSTACMNNFYNTLPLQSFDALIQSYANFINQELLALTQRVHVCANSAELDVAKFVEDIDARFGTCMMTGSAN